MPVRILQSYGATPQEIEDDMPEIEVLHQRGMEEGFMWEYFGGTVTVNSGRKYQVVEDRDE
ncbi:MAG: hypothetical protein CL490_06355 [Acinetobacter sp.]|nr:hypothetical protein [Acinetobacter sp.]